MEILPPIRSSVSADSKANTSSSLHAKRFTSSVLNRWGTTSRKGPMVNLREVKTFSKAEKSSVFLEPQHLANPARQNVCLDLLIDGYVTSFVDVFSVSHSDADGTGIGDDGDRLAVLSKHLRNGEESIRNGTLDDGYACYMTMASSLESSEDLRSALFVFEKALQVSKMLEAPDKISTAHARCGVCMEKLGRHQEAAQHYEDMHHLTKHNNWKGDISHASSCYHLIRAYTMIANDLEEDNRWEKAIEYHMRCLARAKEGEHPELVAEANYRLGSAYETFLEPQRALQHLKIYLGECTERGDEKGLGRAHEALARCYVQLGELDVATSHYESLWTTAGKLNQYEIKINAGTRLGDIYNDLKNFEEAVDWYGKSYDVCRAHLSDARKTNSIRIKYGIARANFMQQGYTSCLAHVGPTSLGRLLAWKSLRVETFSSLQQTNELQRSYSVDGSEVLVEKASGEGVDDVFDTTPAAIEEEPETEPNPTSEKEEE